LASAWHWDPLEFSRAAARVCQPAAAGSKLCEDRPVSPPRASRETRLVTRFGTQAQVAVGATRRQFVYRWTAPRSPVLRALVLPLFLAAGLAVLLLALLVLAAFLVLAVAAAAVALILATARRGVRRR
jgi:hypothetical protein